MLFSRLSVVVALSVACLLPVLPACAQKVLRGGVQEDTTVTRSKQLSRPKNVQEDSDPFSRDDDGALELDPGKGSFAPDMPKMPPMPKQPLRARAEQEEIPRQPLAQATPRSAPPDLGGEEDPTPIRRMAPQQQPQPRWDPNDPDNSPEMQLLWDMWHKRVANAIYDRYAFLSKAAFKYSRPLAAVVSYTVTRDGHIMNVTMTQKSNNILYNIVVMQVIKSLDGDMSLLTFPPGSRRMFVPKLGTFQQNCGNGQGFRYTTNDREVIPGGMRR